MNRFLAILTVIMFSFSVGPGKAADVFTIKVGYSPGGSYDLMARLVADHLGAHLPGSPTAIVENVPGAGSVKLAKLFSQSGKADGSEIAMISSALALQPVFSDEPSFDPTSVYYIGTMSSSSSYCIVHKQSGIETFSDFLASNAKVGATGKSSTTYTYPTAIKRAFGASFEVVTGFEGGSEIDLAMERDDIQARCGISLQAIQRGGMLDRYNVIAELATTSTTPLEGVTFALDQLQDAETREALALVFSSGGIHHPLIAPGGTDAETVANLRNGLRDMVASESFQDEAEARGMTVNFREGHDVEAIIKKLIASDASIKAQAREMVQ